MENRDFKGIWIPKEIWLSNELSLQEKVFLVEINSLDNEAGCFASNAYFAKFFKLSSRRVSEVISVLVSKKLIDIFIDKSAGNTRIIRIAPTPPLWRESSRPYGGKVLDPMEGKLHHSNTINNTDNIISNTFEKVNEYSPDFEKIWKSYNAEANASGGSKLQASKKFIALSKTKDFRLMFEQSMLQHKIDAYLLDCTLSNRSNKHLSTYLNSREWESSYLCESFQDIEVDAKKVKKLSELFDEANIISIKWLLAYLESSQLNEDFKGSVNTYLRKISDSSTFKMSFRRFTGTYEKSYNGEWLNYINHKV